MQESQKPPGQEAFHALAHVEPDRAALLNMAECEDEPTTIRPFVTPEVARPDSVLANLRNQIGKYEVRRKLGRGSFGVVYLARDPNLDRDIAVKVLRPKHLTNRDIVHRFLQEARATARIGHPGIVTIYDCGMVETQQGPTAFIAMELLAGESLTDRVERNGRLAPELAIEVTRQIASALEAAHRAQVLHRDLKPDNIYLVPDPAMPSGERVKILDFGLAKLGNDGHTQIQNVFGTPRYMSPEQCRSSTRVDHRSDIYSLGCILFELIAGHPPFDGDVRQVIDLQRKADPPRALSFAPDCPPALDELIAQMLAKDPAARPPCMAAVQHGLQIAAAGGDATTVSAPLDLSLLSPPPGALLSPMLMLVPPPPPMDIPRLLPATPMPMPPPMPPRDVAMSGEILVPAGHGAPPGGPRLNERNGPAGVTPPRTRHTALSGLARHTRRLKRLRAAKLAAFGVAVFTMVIVVLLACS